MCAYGEHPAVGSDRNQRDSEGSPRIEQERRVPRDQQVEKTKKAVEAKLADENFVTKAKPEVVAKAREKLAELTEQLETIEKHLAEFNG